MKKAFTNFIKFRKKKKKEKNRIFSGCYFVIFGLEIEEGCSLFDIILTKKPSFIIH